MRPGPTQQMIRRTRLDVVHGHDFLRVRGRAAERALRLGDGPADDAGPAEDVATGRGGRRAPRRQAQRAPRRARPRRRHLLSGGHAALVHRVQRRGVTRRILQHHGASAHVRSPSKLVKTHQQDSVACGAPAGCVHALRQSPRPQRRGERDLCEKKHAEHAVVRPRLAQATDEDAAHARQPVRRRVVHAVQIKERQVTPRKQRKGLLRVQMLLRQGLRLRARAGRQPRASMCGMALRSSARARAMAAAALAEAAAAASRAPASAPLETRCSSPAAVCDALPSASALTGWRSARRLRRQAASALAQLREAKAPRAAPLPLQPVRHRRLQRDQQRAPRQRQRQLRRARHLRCPGAGLVTLHAARRLYKARAPRAGRCTPRPAWACRCRW